MSESVVSVGAGMIECVSVVEFVVGVGVVRERSRSRGASAIGGVWV